MVITSIPELKPEANLPVDEGLPGLSSLFDAEYVWSMFCSNLGEPGEVPHQIRARQISYTPGRRAMVTYVAEWDRDEWVEEDQFAVELKAGESPLFFHFPDDPALPGLRRAASGIEAQDLINEHLPVVAQGVRVETVRYRPNTRAVLRHRGRWRRGGGERLSLFARVMRPDRLPRILSAWELAEHSGFELPQLLGQWAGGGVVWMNKVPGSTVRRRIARGKAPEPSQIFDHLSGLWAGPFDQAAAEGISLKSSFNGPRRLFTHILQNEESGMQALEEITAALRPFVKTWKPTALAHNDFYDDQIIHTRQGTIALVDFEEIGPGDPMMDVGNMLAHLRWMSEFGSKSRRCADYRQTARRQALDKFGWHGDDLSVREAFALFRLATNPFRKLHPQWAEVTEKGLRLATRTLRED